MNAEKLARMQAQVRIGGKGTARRKKKTVHKTDTTDEKKLQAALQKIRVNQIPGIEEVNLFKDDGSVMHFKNPKVQASLPSNTFALHGQYEDKQLTELLPGIINQMGPESISRLGKLAGIMDGANQIDDKVIDNSDDDIPDLVENFEDASKNEIVSSIDQEQINGESELVEDASKAEIVSSINQEQINDESKLAETQEKNGIEHSIENNDVLALDLDDLTLEESDKEAPQVSEKEIMDDVNKIVTSKFEKTVESDSSSSEDCDNSGPAYTRINQLIDEEDDNSNEQKLLSEHAGKDNMISDNDAESS